MKHLPQWPQQTDRIVNIFTILPKGIFHTLPHIFHPLLPNLITYYLIYRHFESKSGCICLKIWFWKIACSEKKERFSSMVKISERLLWSSTLYCSSASFLTILFWDSSIAESGLISFVLWGCWEEVYFISSNPFFFFYGFLLISDKLTIICMYYCCPLVNVSCWK